MENEYNSKHYTAADLAAKLTAGESMTDWARVHRKSEAELEADIADDPDAQLAPGWEHTAVLVIPPGQETLFLDAQILHWFRSKGAGWQAEINTVLRAEMRKEVGSDVA